jgi:uroporphyrinogen-III decarboxylase
MENQSETSYRKRLKRVEDAIALKIPDRVPFFPMTHYFAAKYVGLKGKEAFYDCKKWFAANRKMNVELAPDCYFPPLHALYPGKALESLKCRQIKWPGHGVPNDAGYGYQYVEGEYMKADEYDSLLNDPLDFIIRTYLPRIFESLEPFQLLPSLKDLFIQGYKGSLSSAFFAKPEIVEAFGSVYRAGLEAMKYVEGAAEFHREMVALGFPSGMGTAMYAPFDHISDMLRGMRGVMLDMYRQPEKLLEAAEKIYFPSIFEAGVARAKQSGCPRVFIPLHRGGDLFMSSKQFETFYWPGLKRVILGLIDEGLTPCPFFEGKFDTRLEYLTDLPKGKILAFFDSSDIFRAKEILGENMCLAGNVPLSLLKTGTSGQIEEYSIKLIDKVGKGGGFIMSASAVLDDAEPELVRIWADFTKKYGTY